MKKTLLIGLLVTLTSFSVMSKELRWKGYGVEVVKNGEWVTVDGKPAALEENNPDAKAYQQGLYSVLIYKSGKVALVKDNTFVGYLKKK